MIIAIDPGKSGGIAVRCPDRSLEIYKMPEEEDDLVTLLTELAAEPGVSVFVEKVGGYAGRGQPGSAMFTFGWWAAAPVFIFKTLGIQPRMVPPQVWMKRLGFPEGATRTALGAAEWKGLLWEEAQRRFPKYKVLKQVADALLLLDIAERGLLP